jgi:hypothetical protein
MSVCGTSQRQVVDVSCRSVPKACRPESNGDTVVDSTEADQGNLLPMEMMKRLLKAKGLHQMHEDRRTLDQML